uniref:Uncharacterized protein n=1 Tax=Stigmatella aurantiaca TaxID=41 RepID=A0A7U3RL73_STIAU|nr:hypothetical protein [Stigmatella aurantiaca]
MRRSSFLKGTVLAACCTAGSAFASIPIIADIDPVLNLSQGSTRDMRGWIEIQNPGGVDLWASARSFSSPRGYSLELSSEPVRVVAGGTARIAFWMTVSGDGRYHVTIPFDLLGQGGERVSRVEGTIDLQVRDGVYQVDTFENLFGRPVDQQLDEEGKEVWVFRAAPPPAEAPRSGDYAQERWGVEALSIITDGAVLETTPGSQGDEVQSPTLPLPPPRDSTLPRHADPEAPKFTQAAVDARIEQALKNEGVRPQGMRPLGVVTGMKGTGSFHYTGLDGLLHPAWGWNVYAFIDLGFTRLSVAKTSVNPNGTWNLNLPSVPSGFPIVFTYEPRNLYFTMMNSAGAYYSFSSGGAHSAASNKVLNEYAQAAYLANSDLVGLGEVHRDGMDFWESLKTKGEGIDPVPATSLSLHYPNTTNTCKRSDKKLWSCASSDGNIWIIPAHATGSVLKHELGHQLQFKFWNGQVPDNSSGLSHTLTGCYNAGLALSEGFANFMLMWSNLDRNAASATSPMNIERPDFAGACTTKNLNELWVAGTFWDFYDSRSDNKDTLHYFHTGVVPKMYLGNGKHNSMSEYLNIFKAKVSSTHQTIAEDIFTQNRQ